MNKNSGNILTSYLLCREWSLSHNESIQFCENKYNVTKQDINFIVRVYRHENLIDTL